MMELKDRDLIAANRALRDIFLEASEHELREAFSGADEDFDALAARGRAVAERALAEVRDADAVEELHRGLGKLLQLLRRSARLSIDELARAARVDASELRRVEIDPTFEPSPRAIFQLERHFNLPERSLVVLSGAVRVDDAVRDEVVRFAASAEHMSDLTREERKLLNQFVKFLKEYSS